MDVTYTNPFKLIQLKASKLQAHLLCAENSVQGSSEYNHTFSVIRDQQYHNHTFSVIWDQQ